MPFVVSLGTTLHALGLVWMYFLSGWQIGSHVSVSHDQGNWNGSNSKLKELKETVQSITINLWMILKALSVGRFPVLFEVWWVFTGSSSFLSTKRYSQWAKTSTEVVQSRPNSRCYRVRNTKLCANKAKTRNEDKSECHPSCPVTSIVQHSN